MSGDQNILDEKREFEDVIGAWDDSVPCLWRLANGRNCGRPARWMLNYHGCVRGTVCTQHLNRWAKRCEEFAAGRSSIRCSKCKRRFLSVAAVYSAVRI
ncbi:hypothetical protein FIV07_00080 [Mycobacterium sp. THAF192]|nr:hypothetical protein FIV07_00080 [Mycobacterium sp. THAF192]